MSTPKRKPKPVASAIDKHIGAKIREARAILRLTQVVLGERLGISWQQVQKYEQGRDRVSAGRLLDLCQVLNVRPEYFYAGQWSDHYQPGELISPEALRLASMLEKMGPEFVTALEELVKLELKRRGVLDEAARPTKDAGGKSAPADVGEVFERLKATA